MPDARHLFALGALRQQRQRFISRCAFHAGHAHFDQLMIAERAHRLSDHRIREPRIPYGDHRLQLMTDTNSV